MLDSGSEDYERQILEIVSGLGRDISLLLPRSRPETWFSAHELRSVRLRGDRQAAFIVGPGDFLDVLRKVDSFHIKDVGRRKRGAFRVKTSAHFPVTDVRVRQLR